MSIEEINNLIKEFTEKLNIITNKNNIIELPKTDKPEKIQKNYMLDWYKKNKEKHLIKLKSKKECICGEMVSYGNRIRHLSTPKHIKKLTISP